MAIGGFLGIGETAIHITVDNITEYFTVSNGSYYFVGNGNNFTTNNGGKNSSTATTTLTAKQDLSNVSFTYSYGTEKNYDKFTLSVAGVIVENAVSGPLTTKTWSGSISSGDVITFTYTKDGSNDSNGDACSFSDMKIFVPSPSSGTGVARRLTKIYTGRFKITENAISITANNISEYFTVSNNSYYFVGDGSTFTTNNGGVHNSTAKTTLTAKQDLSNVSFTYSYGTEKNYDKFTLSVAGVIVENAVSGPLTTKTWSGSISSGDVITFTYTKNGSNDSNGDACSFSDIVFSTEAPPSVAKRLVKGYAGVNNVARLCFAAIKGVIRHETSVYLGKYMDRYAATTIGNYALFGGTATSPGGDTVVAISDNLTKTNPAALSKARYNLAATAVGNYGIFAGGRVPSSRGDVTTVDVYDMSLTHSNPSELGYFVSNLAATTVGNYALFGGGIDDEDTTAGVTAYNASLTRSIPFGLNASVSHLAATAVGNYGIFAGGLTTTYQGDYVNIATAYNNALTKSTPATLSISAWTISATTVGSYALFSGGRGDGAGAIVDVYDPALTKSVATNRSTRGYNLMATTLGDYALFGGGFIDSSTDTLFHDMDAYDTALVKKVIAPLTANYPYGGQATTVGNYALIGSGGMMDLVDIYTTGYE